jgi:DNA-binding CsgD family transcriptional regulator
MPAMQMSTQMSTAHVSVASLRAQRMAAIGHCLLHRLETPLFVADADGVVLEANPAATRRIERRDGLWIDAGGRISVRHGGRWVPLSRWQADVTLGREVALPIDTDGGAPLQLTLRTMSHGEAVMPPGWVLATVDRVVLPRTEALRRRFKFTRTQARLAELLCNGMRPVRAAETLGVKLSTVRSHVGEMYAKTGTHCQAQLMALLHGT